MGYPATLIDRINLEDSGHFFRSSSLLGGSWRTQKPDWLGRDWRESRESNARQKQYFNTMRFRGRYDGPSDPPPDHPKLVLDASMVPNRRLKTSMFRRPSLKALDSNSSTRSTSPLRSPDRFLPRRPAIDSATQNYRVNKDPQSLSNNEKLLRNNEASPDAFNTRRRVTSPVPPANRPLVRPTRRNFTANRTGGGASVLTFQRDPASASGERHVSVGTVWTVGGLAPMNVGVPNGRGRLLGTGTNAPLYTTSFYKARPKAQEEMEKHEGRLAEALDLDRVTRVLEFRDLSISPQKPTIAAKDLKLDSKTVWKGTEWIMEGRDPKTSTTQEVCAFNL